MVFLSFTTVLLIVPSVSNESQYNFGAFQRIQTMQLFLKRGEKSSETRIGVAPSSESGKKEFKT